MPGPSTTRRATTSMAGKTYRLHPAAEYPAKDFWSVVVYDPQTRSMLQTRPRTVPQHEQPERGPNH